MIALAIASGVRTVMNNHNYTFVGVIRKQSEGGAIGAEMTGEVSRNVMSVWDSRFLEKTKVLGILIELYKRYVDDDLIICPPINPGWRYCVIDNTMKYSAELAMSDTDSPSLRTAKILNMIANTLEHDIQMTFDIPENHSDGKMPVLDMEIWVDGIKIL